MWVKLDDQFTDHPKFHDAAGRVDGPGAKGRIIALCVEALCYANKYITDGFVPENAIEALTPNVDSDTLAVAEAIVAANLWVRVSGGFKIRNYLKYQPSRAEVEQRRHVRQDAGKRGGIASAKSRRRGGDDVDDSNRSPQPNPSDSGSKQEATAKPDPDTVPVPRKLRTAASPRSSPQESYRVIARLVREELASGRWDANNDQADLKECIKERCAQSHIAYDAEVVNSAIESELYKRRKKLGRNGE